MCDAATIHPSTPSLPPSLPVIFAVLNWLRLVGLRDQGWRENSTTRRSRGGRWSRSRRYEAGTRQESKSRRFMYPRIFNSTESSPLKLPISTKRCKSCRILFFSAEGPGCRKNSYEGRPYPAKFHVKFIYFTELTNYTGKFCYDILHPSFWFWLGGRREGGGRARYTQQHVTQVLLAVSGKEIEIVTLPNHRGR